MNLVRLARFNINKHKGAAASIIILIFFCQLFFSLAIHNISVNSNLFADKAKEMECVQNVFCIEENKYREEYKALLERDGRVSRVAEQDSVFLWQNTIYLKDGKDYLVNSVFLNEVEDNVLENIVLEKGDPEIITQFEHPIYAPFIVKASYGFEVGDEIKMVYHQQEYVFQIAGFYETALFANANMGAIKYIISDEDYTKMRSIYGVTKILGYDLFNIEDTEIVSDEFMTSAKVMSDSSNSFRVLLSINYATMISIASLLPVLLAYLMLCFVVIIFITIFVMIRHRIANSIEEQMSNIGTLGALGYTSGQITKVYMMEYSILALVGAVIGAIMSRVLLPFVNEFSFTMLGLRAIGSTSLGLDVMLVIILVGLVTLISFIQARKVKNYPPVIAFRKGINNHHFKKNYFSLEKTKNNVHSRLAAKRFMGAIKQNIIMGICVAAATMAMMFSLLLYTCCGKDQRVFEQMTGFEICDVQLGITHAITAQELKAELLEMDEVRKVNLGHDFISVSIGNKDVLSVVYSSYDELETIKAYKGRLPIYDNEVAITGALAEQLGKEIGDSLQVEHSGYKMSYLISGMTQSMINNGETLYFTEEGMEHIIPGLESNALDVYLNKDVNKEVFIAKLEELYGKSIQHARDAGFEDIIDKHERIKAKAQEKMASLMALYGVDHLDYAIMVDGELIKGSSKEFTIEKITDMQEYVQSNIGVYTSGINWGSKVIMVVAAVIIMVIISMLIKNSLTRQKLNLGIYKGLGYTTKELMFQVTVSLIPTMVIGVVCGISLAIVGTPTILSGVFRVVGVTNMILEVPILETIILGIAIIVFSMITAIIGTYKIKDISAYEMLAE
ncbi:MAG: ABC transporter permease [Cellulosilyticum sp.]|nr:ABC transporter permease [Cellulosilyticum sp.]